MSKKKKVPELFGSMVFNEEVMKQRLSSTCYRAWKKCVEDGTPLSLETAHEMAAEMKNWAMDREFTPQIEEDTRAKKIKGWEKAVKYAYGWAKDED